MVRDRGIAKARELRDRYLEHVNCEEHALRAIGKYAVGRQLDVEAPSPPLEPQRSLPTARQSIAA